MTSPHLGGTIINRGPMPEIDFSQIDLFQCQLEEDPSDPRRTLYGVDPAQVYQVNPDLVSVVEEDGVTRPVQIIQANLVFAILRDVQVLRAEVRTLQEQVAALQESPTSGEKATTAEKTTDSGPSLLNLRRG